MKAAPHTAAVVASWLTSPMASIVDGSRLLATTRDRLGLGRGGATTGRAPLPTDVATRAVCMVAIAFRQSYSVLRASRSDGWLNKGAAFVWLRTVRGCNHVPEVITRNASGFIIVR